MRMDKRAIFASMTVIVLAGVFAGAGTFAYFSQTEVVTTTFNAATVNVRLSLDGTTWQDSLTVTTPSDWAPGDTMTLEVYVRNIGTGGSMMMSVDGSKVSGSDALASNINITTLDATEWPVGDYMGAPMSYWSPIFGDGDGFLTLREFIDSPFAAKFWVGSHPPTQDYLQPAGGTVQRLMLVFAFNSYAGNSLQGLSYTFDLEITGTDDLSILGSGSGHGYV